MRFRMMSYTDFSIPQEEYTKIVSPFQKADLAFQANKFSRWDKEQKSAYITALICGKAPSKFIFADVDACLEAARETGVKEDIKYFQHWQKKGVKYLNIDSNNRNNVIVAFKEGNVEILHGDYYIDGVRVTIDSENDTYENLPEVLKDAFDQAMISISVYTDATRSELSDLFICVNEGKPLNPMEKFNSYVTISANIVRELTVKYEDYFADQRGSWFNESQLNRRHIDELIASCAFVYAYGLKKSINIGDLYRDGSDGEFEMPTFKKVFNKFMKEVMSESAYAIANRNSVFDLFVIYIDLYNQKKTVKDNEEFLKAYMEVVSNLLLDQEFYEIPRAKEMKQFSKMVGGRQCGNNQVRNELIMKSFDVDSLTVQLDKKRGYNASEKMILATLGGFQTSEGKDIELSKLHTNAYHGGHIQPHADGHKTTIENGAIQTAEDNMKLGRNPIETVDA